MDEYKIENFIKENPKIKFPAYVKVRTEECNIIKEKLYKLLNINQVTDIQEFFIKLSTESLLVKNIKEEDDIRFTQIMKDNKITIPTYLYMNWYRLDDIDRIRLNDLEKYFYWIWYRSSDDIDIFDDSYKWILSITHYGAITIFKKY